jgi:hypothetical protein
VGFVIIFSSLYPLPEICRFLLPSIHTRPFDSSSHFHCLVELLSFLSPLQYFHFVGPSLLFVFKNLN